jgi:hypothetical protein
MLTYADVCSRDWRCLFFSESFFTGAPEDLAQIVTGYGDAGHALVTGGAFFFLIFFLEFSFCYICP